MTENEGSRWKDALQVLLTLATPVLAVGIAVPVLVMSTPGGVLPTLTQWLGFVGIMLAVLMAGGTIIPLLGGDA